MEEQVGATQGGSDQQQWNKGTKKLEGGVEGRYWWFKEGKLHEGGVCGYLGKFMSETFYHNG